MCNLFGNTYKNLLYTLKENKHLYIVYIISKKHFITNITINNNKINFIINVYTF